MAHHRAGWRLSPRLRKTTLLLHLLCGIGWMGVDLALLPLLLTGLTTDDGATAASCYVAVTVIVPLAVPILSLGILATGLLLGWGTTWGVLRYWWVVVKLVMAVTLLFLVLFLLVPGINDLPTPDATASADAVRDQIGPATTGLLFPPLVSFAMLAIAAIISLFKPWSRTPWSTPPTPRGAGRPG